MKVLLIDFGHHTKQCIHVKNVFSGHSVSFLCPLVQYDKYRKELPNTKLVKLICNEQFYPVLAMLYLLIFSCLYDRVVFITGLEYTHNLKKKFLSLIWCFFSFCYGNKIHLYIKNSNFYLDSALFSLSLKFVCKIYFESNNLRRNFIKNYHGINLSHKSNVSYVYYSSTVENKLFINEIKKNSIIRIGVVGSLDDSRRDYSIVAEEFERIKFILAGKAYPSNELLNLSLKGKLHVVKEYYSSYELDCLISTCDVLLCLNNEDLKYGKFKGTGAFADAIAANKIIIAPEYIDSEREFCDFSIYYSNNKELKEILMNLNEILINVETNTNFRMFTINEVIKKWK